MSQTICRARPHPFTKRIAPAIFGESWLRAADMENSYLNLPVDELKLIRMDSLLLLQGASVSYRMLWCHNKAEGVYPANVACSTEASMASSNTFAFRLHGRGLAKCESPEGERN